MTTGLVGNKLVWRLAIALLSTVVLCGWTTTTQQSSSPVVTYYVDGAGGNDGNSGLSLGDAWLTLGQAESVVEPAKNGGSGKIELVITAGTYREDLIDDSAGATLTGDAELEISGVGEVIIKGSDLTTSGNWSLEGALCGGADCYSHAWTNNWGMAADLFGTVDVVRRREMVFIDGAIMRQYTTSGEMEANVDSFFVNEGINKLFIHLGVGVVPGDYTSPGIELAERRMAFQSASGKNITLNNLTIQHFANSLTESAVHLFGVSNIFLVNCSLDWNNDAGFGAGAIGGPAWPAVSILSNVNLTRVQTNNNGLHALGMNTCDDCSMTGVESSYNNWRGDWGDYHGWSVSNKFMSMRDFTVTDYTAIDNYATGLWFDNDNEDITIDGCLLDGNGDPTPTAPEDEAYGLYLEFSQGPITVNDCIIRNSQQAGLLIANSENITITNSTIYDNNVDTTKWQGDYTQFMPGAGSNDPGRTVTDRDDNSTYDLAHANNTITDSIIYGDSDYLLAPFLNNASWNAFLGTFTSDRNDWRAETTDVFYGTDAVQMDFADWKTDTGEDANSTWTNLP